MIKEIIVVEGRDDTAAVKRAVEAETIETHGFGIKKATWGNLDKCYEERGLIIFTDPDHAGEEIRKRLTARYPNAKQAYIHRREAKKNDNIGIENAKPEVIIEALSKARAAEKEIENVFFMEDLFENGLCGEEGATEKRRTLGTLLGIGYGNSRVFLRKLNQYGITKEEFYRKIGELK